LLALAHWWQAHCWWAREVDTAHEKALRAAQRALILDAGDPWARLACGIALSSAGEHDDALGHFAAALERNPSFAYARALHGLASTRAGRFDEAMEQTEAALRMNGGDDLAGFYSSYRGQALFYAGRFGEARGFMRKSLGCGQNTGKYNMLIGCCGYLGLREEAEGLIEQRNTIGPPLRASAALYNQHLFASSPILAEGFRKAGVPD
jgi:adenylate cyclase